MGAEKWRKSVEWSKARRTCLRLHMDEPCYLCDGRFGPIDYKSYGTPISVEVDHIIPVKRGGDRYEQYNLLPTHRICNGIKGDSLNDELKFKRNLMLAAEDFMGFENDGIDWLSEVEEDCE